MADPENFDARSIVSQRRDERGGLRDPAPGLDRHRHRAALSFPYLSLWGFPERLYMEQPEAEDQVNGLAASPGW